MKKALLTFPVLSFALLAAHSLRAGDNFLFCGWLGMAVSVPFLRTEPGRYAAAAILGLGGLMWLDTSVRLISFRLAAEQSFLRLTGILAAVLALVLFSVWVLLKNKKDN
ncbi:MAG: hypothetical protein R6V39_11445 [Desulfovibrionales bacterium]